MLTNFALKNSVLTLTLLAVLLAVGISSFDSMPRDDMPPFLIRNISIVTSFQGGSPERIEQLITDPIEKVVQEIPEVDFISSESRTGISIINVALKESEFDLQPIFDRIRRKVDGVKNSLPDGSRVTIDDELGDVFGVILGLTGEGYSQTELKQIAEDARDKLIVLPNVAKVEISGIQEERIYLYFNNAKMAQMGLSKKRIQDAISTTNIILSGGDVLLDGRHLILEPSGNFSALADLENTVVSIYEGQPIRIKDACTVQRKYVDPPETMVSVNGKPGLAIAVNLKKGGNIIQMGVEVDETVNSLIANYPHGLELVRVASQDTVVDQSVTNFIGNLLQSLVIVLLTMLLFLGLRTGLIVASLIPATMVMSFLLMSMYGVGLNKVTLASLIIALGMLVDNAIVVSESIMVKMEEGIKPWDAAISSAKELTIPLLTSSLTTAAAFMAFFLAESVLGEIMGNIFLVVTFALLSSWLLAMTIIMLFCVYGLRVSPKKDDSSLFSKLEKVYGQFLKRSLKVPWIPVISAGVLLIVSLYLMKYVPFVFMPKSDRPLVTVNIELPLGTAIAETKTVVDDVENLIQNELFGKINSPVISWSSYVGKGAPKYDLGYTPPESSSFAAHILVNTASDQDNDMVIETIDSYLFDHYPNADYKVSRLNSGGGSANPVEVRLSGESIDKLYQLSEKIKTKLTKLSGTKNVVDDWGMRTKKLLVSIDSTKAQRSGVSNYDIGDTLKTALTGSNIGGFRDGEDVVPIIIKNDQTGPLQVSALNSINVVSPQTGRGVPLSQIASFDLAWQTSKIIRRDLVKTLTVISDIQTGSTANEIVKELKSWLKEESASWPKGYAYKLGGDAEGSSDAMGAIGAKLPISGFIIILLLVAQFNSLKKPFIILSTVPLGVIGVIFGLLITNSYFGFMGFLGVISLSGIVINNAIVLLDRIQFELDLGQKPFQAVCNAATHRFRPILLTTVTTSFGLVPLWMGGGLLWEPMAIGIIFGLLFATLLTLLFVPCFYAILFGVKEEV